MCVFSLVQLGKVNEVLIRPEHSDLTEDCLGEREDSEESVSTVTGLENAINQVQTVSVVS